MQRRLSLAAAIAALLAAPAQAVSLDPGGLGQALIYPYFTVRSVNGNAFNTYLSIVNTTGAAKILRVRLREGHAGDEALGFNLYLAPGDAWAGAVVPDGNGARLITRDASCTNPALANSAGVASAALSGGTTEGYVEVLEMATLSGAAVAHVRARPDGSPRNCGAVQGPAVGFAGQLEAPTGGLMGTLTLINVQAGRDYTVNAEALADLATAPYYRPPADAYPDFTAAEIAPVSHVVAGGSSYRLLWPSGAQAVSSVFMQEKVENEFVFDTSTASGTEWVLTFPTRRLHVAAGAPAAPFPAGGCAELNLDQYDRDRRTVFPTGDLGGMTPALPRACHAVTVAAFRRDGVNLPAELGSALGIQAAQLGVYGGLRNGRGSIMPWNVPGMTSLAGSTRRDPGGAQVQGAFTLAGLPLTGFMVRSFTNGLLTCGSRTCESNYGGAFPHLPRRRVSGP